MTLSVSIGQRFTQLIQHLGLSKNAFAQSLDKTATVIQHLVDERNKPGYDLLCKVFEVYPNVSKDWLLQGHGPMMTAAPTLVEAAGPAAATSPEPPAPSDLFAAALPVVAPGPPAAAPPATIAAPLAAAAPVAPVAVAPALPPAAPAPEVVTASFAAPAPALPVAPAPSPPLAAIVPPLPAAPAALDSAYLTVALQTQYLQHQLALAEQRNQHLVEQQALLREILELSRRSV